MLKELKKMHEFMERPIICQNEKIIVLSPPASRTQSPSRTLWGVVPGGNEDRPAALELE